MTDARAYLKTLTLAGALLLALSPVAEAQQAADLRDEIGRCTGIEDNLERLACFDAAAAAMEDRRSDAAEAAAAALQREFRFSPGLKTGAFTFRLAVSGSQQISRETAASSEVEQVVRRISRALGALDDWSVAVTVHGAAVSLPRNTPYSGDELLVQARTGMSRTGLPEDRYTVTKGAAAEPVLWDDGRVRSPNEHIIIEIGGLSGDAPQR